MISKQQPLCIIIFGPQGSGKGTQAQLLAEKFDLEHIEPGDMLRTLVEHGNGLAKKVDKIIHQKGSLVPTDLIIRMIKLRIQSLGLNQGIIFDGAPRRLEEAKLLEKILQEHGRSISRVFFIYISPQETVKRLSKRWICKVCDKPLIMGKDISYRLKSGLRKCPFCGGEIYQRKDDTPGGIRKRLATYQKETLPVVDYFREKGILIEINGEQLIKKVHKDIISFLAF
jgi:adenylate kinase